MDNEFKLNQELKQIFWGEGESICVGRNGCKSIVVCMENGQMAGVPWAVVTNDNGKVFKYNLALCEGVEI